MNMTFKNFDKTHARIAIGLALLALVAQGQVPAGQPAFATAEEAHRALFKAVQNHDDRGVARILGVNSDGMFSDNEALDKLEREQFTQKYEQMHRLGHEPGGALVLYVGAENWPFPFPLISKNGAWRFDSNAGMDEVLFRRIGDNENTVIQRMQELAAGKAVPDDNPFHGYYFRAVAWPAKTDRGGKQEFAFVAYPVEYRSCGVMTFFVNQSGVVHEKDLGPDTETLAKTIAKSKPGRGWHPAE